MGEITEARERMVNDTRMGATEEWTKAKGLDEGDFREAMMAFGRDGSNLADTLIARAIILAREEGSSMEEVIEALPETTRVALTAIAAASFRLGYTIAEARVGKDLLGD